MNKIRALILVVALMATGCSGKLIIENEPCDAIVNRDDQQVCGKDRVHRACRGVADKPGVSVCEKL